ncbi:MAG: phage portal protein [Desulfobacterales bacterium]|nr:phage portal protein [Desulfobacterales bacterium]
MNHLKVLDSHGNKIPASHLSSAYEGATFGRRLGTWGAYSSGPNTALFSSLSTLRARSRELTRNNPLSHGAVDSFVANLIGTSISPRWQIKDSELKEKIQELWIDSIEEMDASGLCDFYGMQSIVARALIEGGECLVRFRMRKPDDGLIVPMQLQVIEGDHLDETYSTIAPNGNEIRMGIEINKAGQRVAYWLYNEHPGENFVNTNHIERVRIPASEILHIYRPLRPGQMRGRPWMASIIVKMHEIDQCVDAELVRRKTTAMFGGFITRPPGEDEESGILGKTVEDNADMERIIALEPGTFPELPPGYGVNFSMPTDVSGNYVAWMKQQLRDIARGIGVTYEQLSGDLEGVNYSSIRAGLLEFRRLCKMIQIHTLVFQLCKPVAKRWLDTAVLCGAIEIPDYSKNRRIYNRIKWCPDGWDWVDPLKDQHAKLMAVRGGFESRAHVVAEMGHDIEIVDNEITEDLKRTDKLGLVLDSDPRKTAGSGSMQTMQTMQKIE